MILKGNNFIWPISLFGDEEISNIASGGYICPLFFYLGSQGYIPTKHLKRYFELYQNQLKKWISKGNISKGKIQITFHQDPLMTLHFGYPLLDPLLGLDNPKICKYSRYRAWVLFKDQTMTSLRASYRQTYRNVLKRYSDQVKFHFGSLEPDTLARFQAKHLKLAGRSTKPQECWDILGQMVLAQECVLIELDNNFVYFLLSSDQKYAYYGINASDKSDHLAHRLIDAGVGWLLEHDFDCLDLGNFYWHPPTEENLQDTLRDQEIHDPAKLYEIGFFKLGFANKVTPDYYYQVTFDLD